MDKTLPDGRAIPDYTLSSTGTSAVVVGDATPRVKKVPKKPPTGGVAGSSGGYFPMNSPAM